MARNFVRASSMNLSNANAVLTTVPMTFACWFKSTELLNNKGLITIGDTQVNSKTQIILNSTENVQAIASDASVGGTATSTTAFSSGVWSHAAGVFTSATSRAAFLNGGGKGTDTTNKASTGLDITLIGCGYNAGTKDFFMDGDLAEVGIWNAALTDTEVAMLAKGMSPLLIRPANLVMYVPLMGNDSPEIDLVGGFNFTLNNAPTKSAHPRVFRYHRIATSAPVVSGATNVGLTGVEATGATGSLAPQVSSTILLSAIQATASPGTITTLSTIVAALTGIQATGNRGTLATTASVNVVPAGVQATGNRGTLNIVSTTAAALAGILATGAIGSPVLIVPVEGPRRAAGAKPGIIRLDSRMRAALGLQICVPFREMNGGIAVDLCSGNPLKASSVAGWGASESCVGGKTNADNASFIQVAVPPIKLVWPLSIFWRGEFISAPTLDAVICGIWYGGTTQVYPYSVLSIARDSFYNLIAYSRNDGTDYWAVHSPGDYTVGGMQSHAMVQFPGTQGGFPYKNGVLDGTIGSENLQNVNLAPATSTDTRFMVGDSVSISGQNSHAINDIALLGNVGWTPEQVAWLHNNAELLFASPVPRISFAELFQDLLVALTGLNSPTSVGTLANQISAAILLAGRQGTLQIGSITAITGIINLLGGIQATGAMGAPGFVISPKITLNTLLASGALGNYTVLGGILQQLVGLQSASTVGQFIFPLNAIAQLLGISTAGLLTALLNVVHDVSWRKEAPSPTTWSKENEQQSGSATWSSDE